METFLPHPQYPQYLIGTNGTIISTVVSPAGRKRRTHINRLGYECVILSEPHKKPKTKKVHRLVAETHLPNPYRMPEVNHINHNKADNRLENLEWVTHQENIKKARVHHGAAWVTKGTHGKPVIATPVNGGDEVNWPSARAFAVASGNPNRVANICKAIQTGARSMGFYWRFATLQTETHTITPT